MRHRNKHHMTGKSVLRLLKLQSRNTL